MQLNQSTFFGQPVKAIGYTITFLISFHAVPDLQSGTIWLGICNPSFDLPTISWRQPMSLRLKFQMSRDYHFFILRPSISLKCLSRVARFKSYCRATAAIHISFSGIGFPFFLSAALMAPYSNAVSSSTARIL